MQTMQPKVHARGFLQCLERWDRWLQERLAPAIVAVAATGNVGEEEYHWNVEFPLGAGSVIRIPNELLELEPDEFSRMADGLSTYRWGDALEKAGPEGIRILCPEAPAAVPPSPPSAP